jgi:hypothetical protein
MLARAAAIPIAVPRHYFHNARSSTLLPLGRELYAVYNDPDHAQPEEDQSRKSGGVARYRMPEMREAHYTDLSPT